MAHAKCPHCQAPLAFDDPLAWQLATCSNCGRTFRKAGVPAAATPQPPQPRPPELVAAPPPVPPPLPTVVPEENRTGIRYLAAGVAVGALTVGVVLGVVGLAFLIGRQTGARPAATKVDDAAPTPVDAGSPGKSVQPPAKPLAPGAGREGTAASAKADGATLEPPDASITPAGPVVWLPDKRVADALPQSKPGSEKTRRPPGAAPMKLADLVELIEPSVVRISAKMGNATTVGSGFVVDAPGTVVTNLHVVDGSREAMVEFRDGTRTRVLGVVYVDARRDIAILRLPADSRRSKYLRLAPSEPRKGEDVAAFGAPLGLSFTTSSGIVSAIRSGADLSQFLQRLNAAAGAERAPPYKGTWLQTTAPISRGNSGGPLVDLYGDVVGMNTLTFNPIGGENINFAISATDLRAALEKAKGRPTVSFEEASSP